MGQVMSIQKVELVEILPTKIWQEKDFLGTVSIKMQHEGMNEFTICQIHYDYAYTSNAHQAHLAEEIIKLLGGKDERNT